MTGDLPPGWTSATLGEICDPPQYGWTTKAALSGSVRLLRTSDITSGRIDWESVPYCQETPTDLGKYLLHQGDLVVSRAGSVGASALITDPPKAVFASYLIRFRVNPEVDDRFVAHLLTAPSFWAHIYEQSVGVAMPNVNATKLARFPILLPPRGEQERIVEEIDRRLSHIAAAERSLGSALRKLRIARASTEARLVWGSGFPRKTLGDLLTDDGLRNGRSVKDRSKGFPVLRLTCLRGNTIDYSEHKEGDWDRDEAEKYLVNQGDFYVSRGNGSLSLVGRGGLARGVPPEIAFPDTLIRVRVDRDVMLPEFLAAIWNSHGVRRQIEAVAHTTAGIYKINQGHLRAVELPVPPIADQRRLVAEIEQQRTLIEAADRSISSSRRRCNTLRRAILKAAFTGQLVGQDPRDDPASELLERIQAARDSGDGKPAHRSKEHVT